jgi:hypothetical protein
MQITIKKPLVIEKMGGALILLPQDNKFSLLQLL